jgi:hypothetical protein
MAVLQCAAVAQCSGTVLRALQQCVTVVSRDSKHTQVQ